MIEDAGLEKGFKPPLWVIIEIQFRPCKFVWVSNLQFVRMGVEFRMAI